MFKNLTKLVPRNGISAIRSCSSKTDLVTCELNEKTGKKTTIKIVNKKNLIRF